MTAISVIRVGDRILVWSDRNPTTGEVVAVPLAGEVEFGETGEEAIRPELIEEIGVEATASPLLLCSKTSSAGMAGQRHEVFLV